MTVMQTRMMLLSNDDGNDDGAYGDCGYGDGDDDADDGTCGGTDDDSDGGGRDDGNDAGSVGLNGDVDGNDDADRGGAPTALCNALILKTKSRRYHQSHSYALACDLIVVSRSHFCHPLSMFVFSNAPKTNISNVAKERDVVISSPRQA